MRSEQFKRVDLNISSTLWDLSQLVIPGHFNSIHTTSLVWRIGPLNRARLRSGCVLQGLFLVVTESRTNFHQMH